MSTTCSNKCRSWCFLLRGTSDEEETRLWLVAPQVRNTHLRHVTRQLILASNFLSEWSIYILIPGTTTSVSSFVLNFVEWHHLLYNRIKQSRSLCCPSVFGDMSWTDGVLGWLHFRITDFTAKITSEPWPFPAWLTPNKEIAGNKQQTEQDAQKELGDVPGITEYIAQLNIRYSCIDESYCYLCSSSIVRSVQPSTSCMQTEHSQPWVTASFLHVSMLCDYPTCSCSNTMCSLPIDGSHISGFASPSPAAIFLPYRFHNETLTHLHAQTLPLFGSQVFNLII